VREAPRFLRPGACLCLEVGQGQAEIVTHLLRHTGAYARIQLVRDTHRITRALIATTGV